MIWTTYLYLDIVDFNNVIKLISRFDLLLVFVEGRTCWSVLSPLPLA